MLEMLQSFLDFFVGGHVPGAILAIDPLTLGLGGALLGGIFGGSDDTNTSASWIDAAPEGGREAFYRESADNLFGRLFSESNAFDQGLYGNSVTSSNDFARLLEQYAQGPLISEQDAMAGTNAARSIFNPQRLQLQQGYAQGLEQAGQTAASLGRSADDPILRARALQEYTRQSGMLGAEEAGLATQLGLMAPERRMGFMGQAVDTRNMLANRANQNRAALLGTGQDMVGFERNSRLDFGVKRGSSTEEGSFGKAMGGALAGFGAGASIGKNFFGGDGGSGKNAFGRRSASNFYGTG